MKTDREKLIDFADAINIHDGDRKKIGGLVDIYLKSINKALDETKTVNNNEQTKEVCDCKSINDGVIKGIHRGCQRPLVKTN